MISKKKRLFDEDEHFSGDKNYSTIDSCFHSCTAISMDHRESTKNLTVFFKFSPKSIMEIIVCYEFRNYDMICCIILPCVEIVWIRWLFWSVFFRIPTEYGNLLWKSLYSVRKQENTDQKKTPNLDDFQAVLDIMVLCMKLFLPKRLFKN